MVALVCPASPPASRLVLRRAAEALQALGLEPRIGPHAARRTRFLAGRDEERVADLHWAFGEERIKGVFALRGGYGTIRLLPRLDWDLLRTHPKVVIGMSDLTAFQMAALNAGLVTFAGPMLAFGKTVGFTPWAARRLWTAIGEGAGAFDITAAPGDPAPITIVGGSARGPLVGGNLATLLSLVATPWEAPFRGCILVIEDVGEAPYRVDRMLTHLTLSGRLEGVVGLVFGRFHECFTRSEDEVIEVIAERVAGLGVPALYGLALGHQRDVATWPQGCMAELDASSKTLRVIEPGVV